MTEPSGAPRRARAPGPTNAAIVLTLLALLVAVLVIFAGALTVVPTGPHVGAPVVIGTAAIRGNASAGWTYTLIVYASLADERPGPIVWGNVIIVFTDSASGGPFTLPSDLSVHVLSVKNATIAEWDVSHAAWVDGFFVLVQTGQTLVVQGMLAPGKNLVNGTTTGPGIWLEYPNEGRMIFAGTALATF